MDEDATEVDAARLDNGTKDEVFDEGDRCEIGTIS